ncbi:MAG: hypothetical protein EBS05_15860 [Proteobacteria bacterium]|nr:hypothetical protein [Pseudomonadota bacterium]
MERIERNLGGTRAAFATATYIALCRLANERGTPTLKEHVSLIAHLSGLGTTTTREMMRELERLELVSVTLNKLPHSKGNDASSYVLRSTSPAMRDTSNAGQHTSLAAGDTQRVGCLKKGREAEIEREEHPVQLPKGFPATEADAARHAAFVGCTEDFARLAWNESAARGGTDYGGNPIGNFRAYLAARTAKERGRQGESKASGRGPKPKGSAPDHSKEFFEGTGL